MELAALKKSFVQVTGYSPAAVPSGTLKVSVKTSALSAAAFSPPLASANANSDVLEFAITSEPYAAD